MRHSFVTDDPQKVSHALEAMRNGKLLNTLVPTDGVTERWLGKVVRVGAHPDGHEITMDF